MTKMLKATHQGKLKFSDMTISCAVLEDGTRVLVERSVANALGKRGSGQYWRKRKSKDIPQLPEYISASYLEPYINKDLFERLKKPISYINDRGKEALGIDATLLPEICDVWVTARDVGGLDTKQQETANKAYILMKGFAVVGITALVDAATGYEKIRDRDFLQNLLDKYLRKKHAVWAKRFPDDFYKEMFRLKNWQWKGMKLNRPSCVGKYTKDIVYSRLAPNILEELEKKNPKNDKGERKTKHHQWLTDDLGVPALGNHLHSVIALMRASSTWDGFCKLLARAFPVLNEQTELPFDEEYNTE
jgi:hypothetical protein